MAKRKLSSGEMPGTDSSYEEFEGALGSIYATYLELKLSDNKTHKKIFNDLNTLLRGFSERHGLQYPEKTIKKPRAKSDWGKPHSFPAHYSAKDYLQNGLKDDFNLDSEEDIAQLEEIINLLEANEPQFEKLKIAI